MSRNILKMSQNRPAHLMYGKNVPDYRQIVPDYTELYAFT